MPGVPPQRFTYLGPEGTFAEQALLTLPAARNGVREPSATVPEALDAVRSGAVGAALVPLENSVEGAVGVTLDELAYGAPLLITRELLLQVRFGLFGRPGTKLESVRTVASHPHGLAQVRAWMRKHLPDAEQRSTSSTSDAAVAVARGDFDAAACAAVAGERQRLELLADDIGDSSTAVTRFVLVTRPGRPAERTGDDLTSLVAFIAHDRAGALLEVLTEFAVRGLNLTRIESRPTKERLGRYCFLLDCSGHIADDRVGEAVMGLRRICADVRFLGSYPAAEPSPPYTRRPGTSDADFADAAGWLRQIRDGATDRG
ncbi:prephenate dehydratase [Fodinicola feengrottensis]|uniref:Prephenate dehydratase n=1 Tax=Fodinicola feengrottensis TaxID=435914 RepID=A0ABN2GT39_9ACTN